MTLDTNLSVKPYFDDFTVTKNFYRVLYRPSVAVQAREMNQMQSILQDQIEKFGSSIYKDGSIVDGCAFTFDNKYNYVKIRDNYANNSAISSLGIFNGNILTNPNGLQARVVNYIPGFESQAPDLNTLYIKYLNSATYPNNSPQSTFANTESLAITTDAGASLGSIVVATVANSTGVGYAFTTSAGTIYKKGFFITVEPQTIVISKYNNNPDSISVGFAALENIITPEIDSSLYDNAAGAPNYSAPGAHRLQLQPTLVTKNANGAQILATDVSNTATFFSLCDFANGVPFSVKSSPQYSTLGADMARRTYETNGDYVVNPFILSVQTKTDTAGNANTDYLSLISGPGIGYVKGYRVEFLNNNTVDLRKGTDTELVPNQIVSSNFGNYFNVTEYCGDFNNDFVAKIELHNNTKKSISNKTFLGSYNSSNKIGTAYCRGVAYSSGIPGADAIYRLYVFNAQMNAGYSITDVKSVVYNSSGTQLAVADIVLTKNASGVDVAVLQDPVNEIMVHPFGQKSIKVDGFSSQQFVYRNRSNATIQTTGLMTVNIAIADGTGTEQYYPQGSYNSAQEGIFIVMPTVNGYSSYKTGNVSITSGCNIVTGTLTTFATDYTAGDFIYINGDPEKISAINSNVSITLANTASVTNTNSYHQKFFPVGVPINFGPAARTINVSSSNSATINIGESLNATMQTSIYYDILRAGTTSIKKVMNRNTLVQINVSNNAGGVTGPWCLGLPDVFQLNHVWVGSGAYSNSNPDLVSSFSIDNGQRDAYYDLAQLKTTSPLSSSATLLVSVDHFTRDESQGHGFFNGGSYPIDDANTANTQAIQTYQIPVYSGIDLRDSIDFRPYAANTANIVTTATNITTNPVTMTAINTPAQGSYLPSPDSSYQATVTHYLPRRDKVSLTTTGSMVITEGVASNRPVLPLDLPGSMTIGTIDVPSYPSLTPAVAQSYNRYDYAIQVTMLQNKRYTMADIGKISTRIDRLEYYTSLSLLEQSAQSMQIRSGLTGQNRFKNGILVDPFRDFTIGNTQDENFRIALDSARGEARPFFNLQTVPMYFDATNSSGVVQTGELVTLPYTSVLYQSQPYSSKTQNILEGTYYGYTGVMTLDPPGDITADINTNPDVASNLEQNANWINLTQYINTGWGTAWGVWSSVNPTTVSSGTQSNPFSQTTTPVSSQLATLGQQLSTQTTQTTFTLGNYLSDLSLRSYIKQKFITFIAKGIKPNTVVYPFFDNYSVSAFCFPLTPYTGTYTIVGGAWTSSNLKPIWLDSKSTYTGSTVTNAYEYTTGNYGGTLKSDESGNVYGVFNLPAGVFTSGIRTLTLTDVSDLTQISSITTKSTAPFLALLVSQYNSINTRINTPVTTPPLVTPPNGGNISVIDPNTDRAEVSGERGPTATGTSSSSMGVAGYDGTAVSLETAAAAAMESSQGDGRRDQ